MAKNLYTLSNPGFHLSTSLKHIQSMMQLNLDLVFEELNCVQSYFAKRAYSKTFSIHCYSETACNDLRGSSIFDLKPLYTTPKLFEYHRLRRKLYERIFLWPPDSIRRAIDVDETYRLASKFTKISSAKFNMAATIEQKLLILQQIYDHKNILLAKFDEKVTADDKQKNWQHVEDFIDSLGVTMHNIPRKKRLYDNDRKIESDDSMNIVFNALFITDVQQHVV
uniref:Uncharacterized protein n=1 Tax=Romanomermis culicivorax TaxID=13658 RepID=A0A915KXW1_ROMCU